MKIDGAPAIVWGNDPATMTFFVGTKAVFNKKKLRIAHNHDEIDLYYDGEVADILHACFDCLPRTDCVFQGDFIGFGVMTLTNPIHEICVSRPCDAKYYRCSTYCICSR